MKDFWLQDCLFRLIMPIDVPLWMLALATAFAVILGKRFLEEQE